MNTEVEELVQYALARLQKHGVWIYHRAVTTSSVYLKFTSPTLGSLRISDHRGKEKYSYKWNINLRGTDGVEEDGHGVQRYYASGTNAKAFIDYMVSFFDHQEYLKQCFSVTTKKKP